MEKYLLAFRESIIEGIPKSKYTGDPLCQDLELYVSSILTLYISFWVLFAGIILACLRAWFDVWPALIILLFFASAAGFMLAWLSWLHSMTFKPKKE